MGKEVAKKMGKNFLIYAILAVIIVGGGAFYGGMKYQQTRRPSANSRFPNGIRPSGNFGNRQGGNFIAGSIIAKDDKSITVKSQDGSTKIVYFSNSTTVGKSTTGSSSDLNTGDNVTVNGTNNADGTVAATNIQIRPSQ